VAEERRPRNLWVKDAYLDQLLSGHKTVEVRVGYRNILRLLPGDRLLLNGRHRAAIKRIRRYVNFHEPLDREDPAAIAPDLNPASCWLRCGRSTLRRRNPLARWRWSWK